MAVKEGTHTGDVVQTRWNTFETIQKIYPKINHERLDHAQGQGTLEQEA